MNDTLRASYAMLSCCYAGGDGQRTDSTEASGRVTVAYSTSVHEAKWYCSPFLVSHSRRKAVARREALGYHLLMGRVLLGPRQAFIRTASTSERRILTW